MSPSRVNVRTLLCHRDVDLALHCLGSLATCCVDPIALAIHEDGSLTADDRARIAAELGGDRTTALARARRALAAGLPAHLLEEEPDLRALRRDRRFQDLMSPQERIP